MMNRIVNINVFNNPISASSLRGIIHNDPIITILENHIDIFPTGNMSMGTELNIQNGIEYENNVIELFQSRADQLGLTYDFEMNQCFINIYDRNKRTCIDIENEVDIISQGGLYKYNTGRTLQGIPDIIISNRAFGLMFPDMVDEEQMNSPGYSIIEIKNCSLHFNTKGNIDNNKNKNMIQYKVQSVMYREMLVNTLYEDIYDPSNIKCYIMGKNMVLGEVSPEEIVGFRKETVTEFYQRCIDQYLYVKSNDFHNSVNPFQDLCQIVAQNPHLGPNMSNKSEMWDSIKKKIALKTFELTLLPKLGAKQKFKLLNRGITSWRDPSLTAEDLGYKNTTNDPFIVERINAIMDLHRFSTEDVYYPRILKPQVRRLIERVSPIEAFLDLETVNLNGGVCIVQIGTMMVGPDFQKYYSFMVNNKNDIDEEIRIINNWLHMIDHYRKQYRAENMPIYHWTPAEKSFIGGFINKLSKVETRSRSEIIHNLHLSMDNFRDLAQAYLKCPIVIRGVFSYSIKHIVKALYLLGHIPETWEDETIDGLGAGLLMVKALNECSQNGTSLCDTEIAQIVIKYNEIDCRSVYNLLKYIRGLYGLE